jgi:hypothetical protein
MVRYSIVNTSSVAQQTTDCQEKSFQILVCPFLTCYIWSFRVITGNCYLANMHKSRICTLRGAGALGRIWTPCPNGRAYVLPVAI